ncbi:hypothetical protein [Halorussus salinus]|uniref:hypothetical protein n=1 Tax=Halorussus salinus TaxID=1364935 RepID=UPI001092BEF7|nr:hypothetical protein [Halorussus salinus]
MDESLLADWVRRSPSLDAILDSSARTAISDDFVPDDLLAEWRDVFDADADFRDRLRFADWTPEETCDRPNPSEII